MSDAIGPIAVLSVEGPEHRLLSGLAETSESTQQLVDQEVRRLVETAHEEVIELLSEHRPQLESLARALLEAETLDAIDAYGAAGLPTRSRLLVS